MKNILFIHPNYPGQFKHIIPALLRSGEYRVGYISRKRSIRDGNALLVEQYDFDKPDHQGVHRYLHHTDDAVRESRLVTVCANRLVARGFVPDIIVGHTAWGGLLFIPDLFPLAKIIAYCEMYFSEGYDFQAEPGVPASNDRKAFLRCRNLHLLMQMQSMDRGITPTEFQLGSQPADYRNRMVTVHEGVDTDLCRPDPSAWFPVKEKDLRLSAKETVITYVSRGFEPVRGFFQYMETLEILCRELPEAHFLMVGGEKAFYSGAPQGDLSYKQQALDRFDIDHDRVHFTGRLVHEGFRKVIQISSAHVYLTRPLFLSWSVVEAMSMGAPIIASDESPVREFMEHEQNALLVDYYNPRQIADSVLRLVKDKALAKQLGTAARKTIVNDFDISHTVTKWREVIDGL